MDERAHPQVFTIPPYRSFSDALVRGLLANFGSDRMALARGTILVPNARSGRSLTDAFVRRAEGGLLLPRIVAIGDAGEMPGLGIDDAAADVPAAVDPFVRRMILAQMIQQERAVAGQRVGASEALRLATELAVTLDELIAEDIAPAQLRSLDVGPELAVHWQKSLDLFASVLDRWPAELAAMNRIDLPERRNRLLRHYARCLRERTTGFVVAAGVTSAAPAIADVLRTVARIPGGMVVLPGLDIASPDAEWEAIAGGDGVRAIETHPQHHLRLLLDRMGIARAEVRRWRWGDGRPRKAVRARAISNAFAPAAFTSKWIALDPRLRKLDRVRAAIFATPAAEAQGIAIALREALETPERTAALVTPDRSLALRVVAELKRWNIDADDSGGRPLSATPVGVLVQAAAQLGVEQFAPVALLAVLKHPLVERGDARLAWLEGVRSLDIALRGPRPAPGLDGLAAWLGGGTERERPARARAAEWWVPTAARFADFERAFSTPRPTLAELIGAVRALLATLGGEELWAGPDGRAAAALFEAIEQSAPQGPTDFVPADLLPILRMMIGEVAIRPAFGTHNRIAILGPIEARLLQPDLLILGGLNEGVWPGAAGADPWLSPRVRRELGLADPERRVGLAAHDLATGLGAQEVLLTRAARDGRSATVASRFLLRLDAMTGGVTRDLRLPALTEAIDANQGAAQPVSRPAPAPPAAERPRRVSVTEVDRLAADPYAFYARAMLRLTALDRVDAEPGPAWRGSAVHEVLDAWMREDKLDPEGLRVRAGALLAHPGTHPLTRTLWQPRLMAAIDWISAEIVENRAAHREPLVSERKGAIVLAGIELRGIADRIDRSDDATLVVVDYKSGKPPTAKMAEAGFAMQLGLLGSIAQRGGFGDVAGTVSGFEYWSLAKSKGAFGHVVVPTGKQPKVAAEDFVAHVEAKFAQAAARWLTGDEPFVAKLHPEFAPYSDYDQLMRQEEWYGR